jgi:hypothetical protein
MIARKSAAPSCNRLAINFFLIVHLLAISCWALPFANPLVSACRDFVRPYFLWSGLFQSWDMFSPAPKSANSYAEAIVIYEDGNSRNWAFPRMELLNWNGRYSQERYRKFVENLIDDKNAALWPDVADFIARANNDHPVPVKLVLLVRCRSAIIPDADGPYVPAPWDAHVFYARRISVGDLKSGVLK